MKSRNLFVLGAILGGSLLFNVNAEASTYHNGTPKALRGCWYAGQKTYLEYWSKHSGMNTLQYSGTYGGYYKSSPYGLTYMKYKYLGYHTYQLTGWTYSTNQDFRIITPTSESYTYNVRLIGKNRLYLCDRQKTYVKYAVKPDWVIN